jgi:tetratricopeptide (TPR) repeat protein
VTTGKTNAQRLAESAQYKGEEHARQNNLDLAIECYQEAAKKWQQWDKLCAKECYYRISTIYVRKGDMDKAFQIYDTYLPSDLCSFSELRYLAEEAVFQRNYRKAVELYRRAYACSGNDLSTGKFPCDMADQWTHHRFRDALVNHEFFQQGTDTQNLREACTLSQHLASRNTWAKTYQPSVYDTVHHLFIASLCAIALRLNINDVEEIYPVFTHFDECTYARQLYVLMHSSHNKDAGKNAADFDELVRGMRKTTGVRMIDDTTAKLLEMIRDEVKAKT